MNSQNTTRELVGIGSQSRYDEWAKEFSSRFFHEWQKRMAQPLPYGPSRKLPNLLFKKFVLWHGLTEIQRSRLLNHLHIPLDSFSLVAIRNAIADLDIPKNPTMNFVKDETTYDRIQHAIRDIAQNAGVPAIYFDILAWEMRHQTP